MIVNFIPYFLVCITPDAVWPNGPEYLFNMKVNASAQAHSFFETDPIGYTELWSARIHCRSRNPRTLSCSAPDVEMFTLTDRAEVNRTVLKPLRFDVTFGEFGAESVTVPFGTDPECKQLVNSFALQLTIGADLSGKTDMHGVFTVTGPMLYRYKMNVAISYPPDGKSNKTNNLYYLELLPRLNKPTGRAIEITKEKHSDTDSKLRTVQVGFLTPKYNSADIYGRNEQYRNRMRISDHTFESSMYEHDVLYAALTGYQLDVHVELKLTDIVGAGEPFPDITNSETISVIYLDELDQHFRGVHRLDGYGK